MLGTSIGLNAVSEHGACTAVFVAVAAVCVFLTASIRTLDRMSWLAWIGVFSIIISGESFPMILGENEQKREKAAGD